MKQKLYLKPHVIMKYLLGDDEADTLITCKSAEFDFLTSDQDLYEALGAVADKSMIDYHKLVKLLEVCDICSFTEKFKRPKKILTEARVGEIRSQMMKKDDGK